MFPIFYESQNKEINFFFFFLIKISFWENNFFFFFLVSSFLRSLSLALSLLILRTALNFTSPTIKTK